MSQLTSFFKCCHRSVAFRIFVFFIFSSWSHHLPIGNVITPGHATGTALSHKLSHTPTNYSNYIVLCTILIHPSAPVRHCPLQRSLPTLSRLPSDRAAPRLSFLIRSLFAPGSHTQITTTPGPSSVSFHQSEYYFPIQCRD